MREERGKEKELPTASRLWAGWLVAVAAWGLHLFASYGLVELYCRNQGIASAASIKLILHGLTGLCFLLAFYGGWLAWRTDQSLAHGLKEDGGDPGWQRSRFMARSGIMFSGFLAVVILVQGLPNLVFEPCLQ